jgi:hypothetical protein
MAQQSYDYIIVGAGVSPERPPSKVSGSAMRRGHDPARRREPRPQLKRRCQTSAWTGRDARDDLRARLSSTRAATRPPC